MSIVPLKVWLALAALAAIGVLLWHDHHVSKLFKAERATNQTLTATIAEEREREAKIQADHQLSQETSRALQERLTAVERERDAHPLRLRCFTPGVPAAVTQGGSTSGAADDTGGRVDGGADLPTFDAGPGVSEFQRRCAVNAARQVTLQEFEAKRSH